MKINNLNKLLLSSTLNISNINFRNLKIDSRLIKKNDLFIAIPGSKTDGRFYIIEAIKKGVSLVLSEKNEREKEKIIQYNKIPIIYIKHLSKKLSQLAGNFYSHPSFFLDVIGVTGTNGKTTVTNLISQWSDLLGEKSAIIGTLGNGITNQTMQLTGNTTDSPIYIQNFLKKLLKRNIRIVSIEISSHGLSQCRIDSLKFSVAIFTNLTHDHLDYHKNMIQYEMTKWKLFSQLNVNKYIINANDRIGEMWLKKKPNAIAVGNKSFHGWSGGWLYPLKIQYFFNKTEIYFCSSWGKGIINSTLIGNFNVTNLLLSLTTLLSLGYPLSDLLYVSNRLKPVPGRMELFYSKGFPIVIVDYAHSPDALEKALISSKLYCKRKLWCIFGCGGDRDKQKRPLMGYVSDKYSDRIVLTSDNSRNENFIDIINMIKLGISNLNKVNIVNDRKQAIKQSILQACQQDTILIAGKGNENYQIINKQHLYFSDRKIVKDLLGLRNDSI